MTMGKFDMLVRILPASMEEIGCLVGRSPRITFDGLIFSR